MKNVLSSSYLIAVLLAILQFMSVNSADCPPGEYTPDSGSCGCLECTAGYSCTGGNNTGRVPCVSGKFSGAGESTCEDCLPGTFSNKSGADSCTTCSAGYECPGRSSEEYPCKAGTYSGPGEPSCITCPAGSYCKSTSSTYEPCNDGEWSNTGMSYCSSCSAGRECPDKTAEIICPSGTYSEDGDSACHTCPSGTYAVTPGQGSCQNCIAGFQCSDPTSAPVQCTVGSISAGGASSCTTCGLGTISSSDNTACISCPDGSECPSPSLGAIPCRDGYYSASGDSECTICSIGHYCVREAAKEEPCPANKYADEVGQQECMDCPSGFSCTSDLKTPCAPGEYSAASDSTCTSCSSGYYCPQYSSTEIPCPDGTYSEDGASSCTTCPANFECINHAPPTSCAADHYSLGGQASCTPCGTGDTFYGCSGSSASSNCSSGQYDKSGTCTDCDPGYYCDDPSKTDQEPCQDGTYSTNKRATFCTTCPPGFACPDKDAPGNQCQPGTYSTGGKTTCSECMAGYYCPYINQAVAIPCPLGMYSYPNNSTCQSCPKGKECKTASSPPSDCPEGTYSLGSATSCTSCPAGFACPSTDTRADSFACSPGSYSGGGQPSCTVCPAAKACPLATSATEIDCQDGFTSAGNRSSCLSCPSGHECPDKTDENGTPCPSGKYSFGGQTECAECPLGFACPSAVSGPVPCTSGYYASSMNNANCTACPAGFQCSNPEVEPVPCVTGTFSYNTSVVCQPCSPGYTCSDKAIMPNPPDDICTPGHWCDGETSYDCPPGTFYDGEGARTENDCKDCPAGYFCTGPGADTGNFSVCSAGNFCPIGSAVETPCPSGTYNSEEGSRTESNCTACPAGLFCDGGSSSGTDCPPGFYCVVGQPDAYRNPCPAGTYGDETGYENATQCTICPVGHYCPYGSENTPSITPLECPDGTYNPLNGSIDKLSCAPCDAGKSCNASGLEYPNGDCALGHYCPTGTSSPFTYPCQAGTYTDKTNATRSEECTPCPPGYFCTLGTYEPRDCWPGYYCLMFTSTPTRYACPPGTYSNKSNNEKLSDCSDCVPGYYCSGGESDVTAACPPGYYCPEGTSAAEQYPCPNTTYNSNYRQDEEADCMPCTQGHYCEKGTVNPVECPLGTYMPYGADQSDSSIINGSPAGREDDCLPCPGGSICRNGDISTSNCGVGYYSKPQNSECEKCLAGYYCDNDTTSYDDMINNKKCPIGYYCAVGLKSESDKTECTRANYCPEATPEEIPCPTGTYNPDAQKGSITDCLACTAGYFCLEGSWEVTGPCDPGYYCPTDIVNVYPDTSADLPLIGSFGPEQIPCPGGTYRNATRGEVIGDCDTCTAGNYCPSGSVTPTECPRGFHCVPGLETPTPCPKGTYGNRSGLTQESECNPCDKGKYCDSQGMVLPRGECDAGYLCYSGASESNPNDGVTGELCPRGGYCTQGSYEQKACPQGTYSNSSGQTTAKDCRDCDPGYFCSDTSGSEPNGPCRPGYYCLAGSSTPNQYPCSNGSYCPSGSVQENECPIGTYNPSAVAGKCRPCPAGFTCPNTGMTEPLHCPAGSYCPSPYLNANFSYNASVVDYLGTYQIDGVPCPPGTYNPESNAQNDSSCRPCPIGKYCSKNYATEPTGNCSAGYICYSGSNLAQPSQEGVGNVSTSVGERCHAGKYCLEGATGMYDCPPGTFSPVVGARSKAECLPCLAGKYCAENGMTNVSGDCDIGHYCSGGASSPRPKDNSTEGGDECTIGSYCDCPDGCSEPRLCPTGTYTNRTGMSECLNCEPGYFCVRGRDPELCSVGHYCIGSSSNETDYNKRDLEDEEKPCPRGTYNNRTGLSARSQCTPCDPGKYCGAEALTEPSGVISAGFYANGAAGLITPTSCSATDTFSEFDCNVCPAGSYCPEKSSKPLDCPKGTLSEDEGLENEESCTNCTQGYFCNGTGLVTVSGPCMAGYYCSGGSQVPAPDDSSDWGGRCPKGSFCPEASNAPIYCEAGTYADVEGLAECKVCQEGYYCIANATQGDPCPVGNYCPNGTESENQFRCPAGKYNSLQFGKSIDDCLPCPAGKYCEIGSSDYTGNCSAGYYCQIGASTSKPLNSTYGGGQCEPGQYCPEGSSEPIPCTPGWYCGMSQLSEPTDKCAEGFYCSGESIRPDPDGSDDTGGPCPMGFYCPLGSAFGVGCPPGTFLDTTGNKYPYDCRECLAGSYCDGYNLTMVSADCSPGYYCPEGQNTSTPTDYICDQGYYCPAGSSQQLPCGNGTYQDLTNQGDCKICPAGFYCDASPGPVITYNGTECKKGYFCPEGTSFENENPCEPGTFNTQLGAKSISECVDCRGGYYCDEYGLDEPYKQCEAGYFCKSGATKAAPDDTSTTGQCPQGFYCPVGTIEPSSCPPGSYGSSKKLKSVDECAECPIGEYCGEYNLTSTSGPCQAGYFCPANSSSPQQEPCPKGSYCTLGTIEPVKCPIGTFSNQTNLSSKSECLNCTAGKFCDQPGLEEPAGDCYGGYYCPEGSTSATPSATYCTGSNTFCPNGSASSKQCEDGSYVDWEYAEYCPPCPEGFMCTSLYGIEDCPAGYFCPAGTGADIIACPKGTYNPNLNSVNISQCLACPAGRYCEDPGLNNWTASCSPGYFCVSGMDRPNPDGDNSTAITDWCFDGVQSGYGGRCPPGSYCKEGATFPELCPSGNYSLDAGASICDPCPEGYYCEKGTSNFTEFICPTGHFCPESTDAPLRNPCPRGTYNNMTGKSSESDCVECPGGMYCPDFGTSTPTLKCQPGYYCPNGSTSGTTHGCARGYYCPEGSADQTLCTAGYYCDGPLLSNVTAECSAGYYCLTGASYANGSDAGGDCPLGQFCPVGSPSPQNCPAGTYLNVTNGESEDDCIFCDPGHFCSNPGADRPNGLCSPGYYCDGLSNNITTSTPPSYKCPKGHMCDEGSIEPVRCESGYYQDEEAQSQCKECPSGYYCDNTFAPVVIYNASSICPKGYFCPNGTKRFNQYPCLAGTFRNDTGGESLDSCTPCTGGMFCEIAGLPEPTDPCDAGFFCKSGSSSAAPFANGDLRGPCPPGFYCETGTTSPSPCPVGTYNPLEGSTNSTACVACSEGNYCPYENMTNDGFTCKAGYYCPSGSKSETEIECDKGFYCESGVGKLPCPMGTWSNQTGLTSAANCTQCSAGFYCPRPGQTEVTDACLEGFYCEEGQNSTFDNICPYGVYCPNGTAKYYQCEDGTYTSTQGQSSCDECIAGFYCLSKPPDDYSNIQTCSEGYYCPNGTGMDLKPCPAGTYSNTTGLATADECQPCDSGFFCDGTVRTEPNGECDEGYFCTTGVNVRRPSNGTTSGENCTCSIAENTGWGGICPLGFYCPARSTTPLPCGNGTYADEQGLGSCKQCPAGFYCPPQSVLYTDKPCPAGHFCPVGTEIGEKYPCDQGYYNPKEQSESIDACIPCKPGEYCGSTGMAETDGNCSEGYYCSLRSDVPNPNDPAIGGECEPGYYCPPGARSPFSCPVGYYCQRGKLPAPEGMCAPGYYCVINATSPQPDGSDLTGYPCPEGYFCTAGTESPSPCPRGTFSNALKLQSESECNNCSARMFCNTTASLSPSGLCAPGYYCPGSDVQPDPIETPCPIGYSCPEGSDLPTPCDSGYYQDEEAMSECKLCPSGCVCNNATSGPVTTSCAVVCPSGHFCPNGTKYENEYPCPKGTYFNGTGLKTELGCLPCPATFACDDIGISYPTTKCSAGFYCKSSADSPTPNLDLSLANQCPQGFYCPKGTDEPISCPIGTFSDAYRLMNESQCQECTPGYYCDVVNLTSVAGPCNPGYYCPSGSTKAEQVLCDAGFFCTGTSSPEPCPVSTYSNTKGLSAKEQCLNCTAGFYCEEPGQTNVTGACSEGYYCPIGSLSATQNDCPIGMYCPAQSPEPYLCPDGLYAPTENSPFCEICPERYFCLSSNIIPGDGSSLLSDCPAGSFCPNGTGANPHKCPQGTYSTSTKLASAEECNACDPGKYCSGVGRTKVTDDCSPGFYCVSGVWASQPITEDGNCNITLGSPHKAIGNICPIGSFCVKGSQTPEPCAAGTYMDQLGQSSCYTCPEGYFCPYNTSDYSSNLCPKGHYCPLGTQYDIEYKCPAGTYNNRTTQKDQLTGCLSCPRGRYCDGVGTVDPESNECDGGYYCTGGAQSSQGTPSSPCEIGYYCPQGTVDHIICPAGYYCESPQLSSPSNLCEAGFYCPNGSVRSDQEDCPAGFYCVEGTPHPEACPAGTFRSSVGGESISSCSECTPGFYCESVGLDSETDPCDPGYYCDGGDRFSYNASKECPLGYYCPRGSPSPLPCNSGSYQNLTGQSTCVSCPAGFFCYSDEAVISPETCKEGYYCPIDTGEENGKICPAGTFNNATGRTKQSDCLPCLPRYYCPNPGNTEGTGGNNLCPAGYYCVGGEKTGTENSCPAGSYCIEGSSFPVVCPAGTTSTEMNVKDVADCSQCPAGRYCTENSTATGNTLPCDPGYVCVAGAYQPNPVDGVTGYECPPGYKCPGNTPLEEPCDPGTYQPLPKMDSCKDCEAGTYCPYTNMTTPLDCEIGFYCEVRSSKGQACPSGTYSNQTGLSDLSECIPCPPGRYCDKTPTIDPSGNLCSAGYYCASGASYSKPALCSPGKYCVEGAISETDCPPGTMRSSSGGASENDCFPCSARFYCETPGLTSPTGLCSAGYYCPGSAKITTPEPSEYQCPTGSYCLNGTADPTPCDPGTYQPNIKSISCIPCETGYYCLRNSSVPEICPLGSYCPAGSSAPILCPAGTFGGSTGLQNSGDCSDCTAGSYCVDGEITGPCAAGYLCISGSPTPTPDGSSSSVGGPCPFGYYCLEGTIDPSTCPDGLVISNIGASTENNCTSCPAGYNCANSTIPLECDAGQYCPASVAMTPCPVGTYSNKTKAVSSGDCDSCTPGYWCSLEGTVDPTLYPCPVGHYCPLGTGGAPIPSSYLEPVPCAPGTYRDDVGAASLDDCYPCPAGYYCPNSTTVCFNCSDSSVTGIACDSGMYCPEGSANYQWCSAGYYCNETKEKILCPGGYYCPERSAAPVPCPSGSYCIEGAMQAAKCPLGYQQIDGSLQTTFEDTCSACPAGYYGASENRTTCTICRAGVICKIAATTDNPEPENATMNATNSFPCPFGYYCPSGAIVPIACPAGTYNPNEYGESTDPDFCIPCPVNYFNNLEGQIACQTCGGEATQPQIGQSSCQCSGSGREFQPSDQNCPCASGYQVSRERNGDCVRYIYDLCPVGTSRTPLGGCYTDEQWQDYCSNRVCSTPSAYQGVDKGLGACKCRTEDLDTVCDSQCRARQPGLIEFCCPDPLVSTQPQIRVLDSNGNYTYYSTDELNVINAANAISASQCSSGSATCSGLYITESISSGFIGAYDPDSTQTNALLERNMKASAASSRRRRSIDEFSMYPGPKVRVPYQYEFDPLSYRMVGRRILQTTVSVYTGILNPVTCVDFGTVVVFSVSNENYPVYDQDNLYNTNENFDFGGFRDLQNQMQLTGSNTTLFAYQFNSPGVYAFMLSSDNDKKFYVSVMTQGGTCTEQGPFFPQTPLYLVQSGVSLDSTILLAPDWFMIGMLLLISIIIILILVGALILFRKYGWSKISFLATYYRAIGYAFDLDTYSSKGSTVHSIKKYHPNINSGDTAAVGISDEVMEDEFWDHEKQVDMEQFSSQEFYSILNKQSHDVTRSVSKQKDEVKSLYQKVAQQTQSLKDLWAAKLNLQGRSAFATEEDLAAYERKKEELDIELERRKSLGEKYTGVLQQQREVFDNDEKERRTHQIKFDALTAIARRVLDQAVDSLQNGSIDVKTIQFDVSGKAGVVISKMKESVSNECKRIGAWGVLKNGTGARLIDPGTRKPLKQSDIYAPDGSLILNESICYQNSTIGMAVPATNMEMLLANGQSMVIPTGEYFIHPKTGNVLPIQGNLCYDPVSSRIVAAVDSSIGDVSKSDYLLIPYIPFPIDTSTGAPLDINLAQLERRADLRLGAPMIDPVTGLTVPICGVTVHPTSGDVHPVGGSHISPVTKLPTAIEIGSLMMDEDEVRPLPVIAVAFNSRGKVVPIGGTTVSGTESVQKIPILMSDSFKEPLSSKNAHVAGVRTLSTPGSNSVVPTAGGNSAVLNASVLAAEWKVADTLKMYLDALISPEATEQGSEFSVRPELSHLETATKALDSARSRNMADVLHHSHDLLRAEERADILANTGGAAGMMEFQATGQLLPILVGTDMKDPAGSDLQVLILGIDKKKVTGDIVPLAGSMEEPNGAGLVPIAIGSKAVDSATARIGKVVGAKLDPDSGVVVPIVQSGSLVNKRQRKPAPGSLAMLEEEYAAKRGFWRRQRQKETDLSNRIGALTHNLKNADLSNSEKVEEHLEAISDSCHQLSGALKRESERRQKTRDELSAVLPLDVLAILSENDANEKSEEESLHTGYTKLVEKVRNFINRLQLEESRKEERLASTTSQDPVVAASAKETIMIRFEQAHKKIQIELLNYLDSRMEKSSTDLSTVEYERRISELLAIEARGLLKGTLIVSGDYEVVAAGVYGDDIQTSAQSELVPLLKQLIALLDSGMKFELAPEMLTALQQTHSSQQQMKILQAIQENAIQQQKQMEVQRGVPSHSQTLTSSSGPYVMQVSADKYSRNVEGGSGKSTPISRRKKVGFEVQTHLQASAPSSSVEGEGSTQKASFERQSSRQLAQASASTRSRDMMERHALELSQLEEQLRNEEIKKINKIISEVEEKKKSEIQKLKNELKEKLKKCKTDEDKQKVMLEYAEKIRDVEDAFETEKHKRLDELRKVLAEERKRRKKELHDRQVKEAVNAGLDPNKIVPDILSENDDQINKDLQLLAQQQDKLIAELLKAYGEEDDEDTDEKKKRLDEEMEAKIRALNSSRAASLIGQGDISSLVESEKNENDRMSNMRANMKERMKMRRARRKSKSNILTEECGKAFTGEEAKIFNAGLEELEQAKISRIDAAILSAFEQAEVEQREARTLEEIQRLLNAEQNLDQKERDKIMEEFKEMNDNIQKQMDAQKSSQKQVLLAKLEARKKLKEELSKEKAVAKHLKNATSTSSTLPEGMEEETKALIVGTFQKVEGKDFDPALKMASVSDAELRLDQVERLASLEEQHLREKEQLKAKLEKEMMEEREKIEAQMKEQSDLQEAAAIARAKSEAEEKNLNEKQTEKLMKQYKKQAEALSKSLTSERKRQMEALKERMNQKKQKKEDQLVAEQKARTEKELLLLKEERARNDDGQASKVEKKVLEELVSDGKTKTSLEQFVQEVLLPRHLKESAELSLMLERELEAFREEAKAKGEAEREEARELMLARQLNEINELLINNAGEPASKVMKAKRKLEEKHNAEMKQFDADTKKYLESAMLSAAVPLTISQAQKKLQLREKHLKELADTLRSLNPEEMLIKKYADEAALAAAEAERYRRSKASEIQKKLERMKEERRRKEYEANKAVNDQLAALERELSSDSLAEKKKLDVQLDSQAKAASEDAKKEEERIKQMHVDEDERARLLKQHQKDMEKLNAQLEQNRDKARADLQQRLAERRKKKTGEKMTELQEDLNREKERLQIEEANQMNALVKESDKALKSTEDNLKIKQEEIIGDSQGVSFDHDDGKFTGETVIPLAVGSSVEDWSALMMASPFFEELKSVENVLKKHFDERSQVVRSSISTPFIDIQDAQWTLDAKLQAVDLNTITPAEFVVYRFGVFVMKMMASTLEISEVQLLLASQLPNNNYHHNAFRHSILYQRAPTATLFIRRDRLTSVGDLIMVIVHSMAHVAAGQMENDSDPYFLRAFYKGMKTTCEDLFFARARGDGKSGKQSMENISIKSLHNATRMEDKISVMEDLVDVKVLIPSSNHFATPAMQHRISQYGDFDDKQKLQGAIEGKISSNTDQEILSERLRKLRGKMEKPSQSVQPITSSEDLSTESSKEALKSKKTRLENAVDDVDGILSQNSSNLSRFVEGMEAEGVIDEQHLPDDRAKLLHKLRLKQDHTISQIKNLTAK